MTATPGPRLPLVLADSLLSPLLVASPRRRRDDDSSFPPDILHPTYLHA